MMVNLNERHLIIITNAKNNNYSPLLWSHQQASRTRTRSAGERDADSASNNFRFDLAAAGCSSFH